MISALKNNRILNNTIMYRIFSSHIFMMVQVLLGLIFFHLHMFIESMSVSLVIIMLMLITCKDMSPILSQITYVSISILNYYGGSPSYFKQLFPLLIIIIVLLFLKPLYHCDVRYSIKGKLLRPLVCVSIALILGGIGVITIEQYMRALPLYYIASLGIGTVFAYFYMQTYTIIDNIHKPSFYFAKMMMWAGIFCTLTVLPMAIENIFRGELWYAQWSNNICTILFFSIPMTFYLASKNTKFSLLYFSSACLQFMGCILSLSRSGIMFGAIIFIACTVAYIIFTTRINRIISISLIIIAITILAMMLLLNSTVKTLLGELLQVGSNEARVILLKFGMEQFLKYPIFGTGVAFTDPIYVGAGFSILWYHCSIAQVPAMTGILGIFAYSFLFIMQIKICCKRPSKFNIFACIAMFAFELMSAVNPGKFSPVPFYYIFISMLVIVEKKNKLDIPIDDRIVETANSWSDVTEYLQAKAAIEPPPFIDKNI